MTEAAEVELQVDHPGNTPVEVVLDTKASEQQKAPDTPKDEPVAKAPVAVAADEGVESLKAEVERAKQESARRLADAQRQINEAREQAEAAQREVVTTRKDVVTGLMDSLNKDMEAAERDYIAFSEAGDFRKAADAQKRISMTAARLIEAEKGKVALDEEIKSPTRQQTQRARVDDPVESLASRLSEASGDWVRAHPEYVRDPVLNDSLVEAHNAALKRGNPPDSPGYFQFIETRLGLSEGAAPTRQAEPAPTPRKPRAPVAAPVSRDAAVSSGRSNTPNRITLTASEVATATAMGMTVQEYAKNLVALVQEGKINRQL